jgi:hypothetical protein
MRSLPERSISFPPSSLLQALDREGDGGLRPEELFGGPGEALFGRNCKKNLERVEFHAET